MRLALATSRIASAAAAGYLFVWGFAPSDPEWALSGEAPQFRLSMEQLQQIDFRWSDLPQFDFAELELPRLRGPEIASARTSGETPAPASSARPLAAQDVVVRIAPPFNGLELPESAFELARAAEPLRLEAAPHPVGGWVVGYGRRVSQRPPRAVTEAEAEAMLREDLARAELQVREAVRVSLNEEEYAALVEFARSIGAEELDRTLVVLLLNQGNREMAADAFLIWTNQEVDGLLVQNPELLAQRERTRELFLSGSARS